MTTSDNGQHFATRTQVAKKNLTFFREAGRGKALVQLNNTVKFHPGIVLLMGEDGSGRSRVLKQFADSLKNKQGQVCILERIIKNENQLYAAIADGFAMDTMPGENLQNLQKTVFTFLETNLSNNKSIIIALDNTDQCSVAALETLIALHAKFKSMSLILIGDNGLQKMLQRLEIGKLTINPVLLAPLDEREARQYLHWRLPFQITDIELGNIINISRGNIGLLERAALKAEVNHRQKNVQQANSRLPGGIKFSRHAVITVLVIMVMGGSGAVYYFYRDRMPDVIAVLTKAQPLIMGWLAIVPGVEPVAIETRQTTQNAEQVTAVFRSNQEWVEQQITLLTSDISQSM
jgi:type II secretory pathway predicted ATPase ExeA